MRRLFLVFALGALVLTAVSPAAAGVVTTYVDPGPAYDPPVVIVQQAPPPPPVVYYQPPPRPVVVYRPQAPPPPPPPVIADPLVPVMMLGLGALAIAAIASADRPPRHIHHHHWIPPYPPGGLLAPYPWRYRGWRYRWR
jgi:hypothetical protein